MVVGKATWKPLKLTLPSAKILNNCIVYQGELSKYLKVKVLMAPIISPFTFPCTYS